MKIVCFSPNDAVWLWTFPQAQFLETLQQRGDEIVYVYCDREFSSFCMSMASARVSFADAPARKREICDMCVERSQLVRSRFNFPSRPLKSFLTDGDRRTADQLSATAAVGDLAVFELFGAPIGKFAMFETVIQTKSITSVLTPDAESYYRANFRNTYLSACASSRMLDELKPDIGLSYHTAYAYNRTFQRLAEARNIPVWFLNASLNVAETSTHLIAARSDPECFYRKLLDDWLRFRGVPCNATDLGRATDHLIGLMGGGGFGYSNAISRGDGGPLEKLGCPGDKKILLAALSSYDEILAAELSGFGWALENSIFESQIEWVKWLFDFVRDRSDVHLIVRVHPREFSAGDIGRQSDHARLLQVVFAEKPHNVSINLPSDQISIYELLMHVDAVLIAWSSAASDAGMLGIPAVTYCEDILLFPRELVFSAKSREQYRVLIERALAEGWSLERARGFFRWAVLALVRTRVDMTNGARIVLRRGKLSHFVRRAITRIRMAVERVSREELDIVRRPRKLLSAGRIYALLDQRLSHFYDLDQDLEIIPDVAAETASLVRQLWRISDFVEQRRGKAPDKLQALVSKS
jgi:hypothetical protein